MAENSERPTLNSRGKSSPDGLLQIFRRAGNQDKKPARTTQLSDALRKPFPRHLIAQGGIGSDIDDDFFPYARSVAGDDVTALPLRGTGYGLFRTGIDRATGNLTNAINSKLEQNIPVHVAGHSLGGVLSHRVKPMYQGNPNVSFSLLDPPYGGWWQDAPGLRNVVRFLPGIGKVPVAIKEETESGIASDPDMIDWSRGLTSQSAQPDHSPWTNPNYGINRQNRDALSRLLELALSKPYKSTNDFRTVNVPRDANIPITVR